MPHATSGFPVRTLTDDDWDEFIELDGHAFGATVEQDVVDTERAVQEPGRSIGAFDGATMVGMAAAYSFRLGVPGGVLPAAGVTWVGVRPTHRRRGALRSLMTHQLHGLNDAGTEPIAVLWASEPQIYGRFGYGVASRAFRLTVPRDATALRPDAPSDERLRLRLAPPQDWKLVADLYDTVAAGRPGVPARDERWHQRGVRDEPSLRKGHSGLRCVVAEDDGGVRGYARYQTKPDWSGVADGKVVVREIVALDPAARATLYRYLFDLDLMTSTSLHPVAVDDPVLLWLQDIRAAQAQWGDALYVRLVDLPAALTGRTYRLPVDVVLDVTDELCPWNAGRWRLRGDPAGATCERTGDPADVALPVASLGAAYLGGTTLVDLAAAGQAVEERPGSLDVASLAFSHHPAPWCPFVF